MDLRGDERAQSVQVGVVILFGFLIVGLATYQATVVPSQNGQAEFDQSNAVREDVAELRNALQTTGVTGESRPVEVQLGTRFQPRTLFVNPPPSAGTIRTQRLEQENATITFVDATVLSNANGTDGADDYWDVPGGQNFSTKLIVYDGDYREYGAAPDNVSVQFGHVVASYPGDRTVNVTETPALVQNDRLTLVVVQGNLSQNGVDATTVDPSSISRITRREEVTGEANVTVPTTLSLGEVRGLFEPINESSPIDVSVGPADGNAVNVTLDTTETEATLKLGIAAVGVGSDTDEASPAYVDVESFDGEIAGGQPGEAVIEVRDRYGNPVSNVSVNVSVVNGSGLSVDSDSPVVTGADGRVTIEYTGTDGESDATIGVSLLDSPDLNAFNASTPDNESFTVTVFPDPNAVGNGTGGGPNAPGGVQLEESFRGNPNEAVFQLKNTGGQPVNITQSRIAFYFNRGGDRDPTEAELLTPETNPRLVIGGEFKSVTNVTIGPDKTVALCLRFSGSGDNNDVKNDFFVTNFQFDDGTSRQYFITPEDRGGPACREPAGGGVPPQSDISEYDSNEVAYNDIDGDRVYEPSDGEEAYVKQKLKNGNIPDSANLVITGPKDGSGFSVSGISVDVERITVEQQAGQINSIGGNDLQLSANTDVVVQSGVTLDSTAQLSVSASNGDTEIGDATLDSDGQLSVSASNGVTEATGTTITSGGQVTVSSGTETDVSDSTITADGQLSVTSSNGQTDLRRAELTTSEQVGVSGTVIRGTEASITADSSIDISATSSELTLSDGTVDAGGDVSIAAKTLFDLSGTEIDVLDGDRASIDLSTSSNMELQDARLVGDTESDFNADVNNNRDTLFVEGSQFVDGNGDGKTLNNDNDANVDGTTAIGRVRPR